VTTLLEQLSQSNPDITAEEAAEFRACVLTIAQHNETDPKCIGFSLQDWEQWLENGGYGLNNFVAMLKQVCNAALGDAAVATLWDYAQSIATAPEGIPRLIEYVQTTYPGLEQRMTTLEALALEEEQRIQDTAGGMGKKAGIVTGVVIGAVAGLAIGFVARHVRNNSMREVAQVRERIDREAEREVAQVSERTDSEAEREVAQLRERTDSEAEKVYSDKTSELELMITQRGINAVANKNFEYDDVISLRKQFVDRAKVFDFQAYAKREMTQLGAQGFKKFQQGEADRLIRASDDVLTEQEEALAKMVTNRTDMYAHHDLADEVDFVEYAKDRYVLTKAEGLLKMNDKDFYSFLKEEGKSFVRGVEKSVMDDVVIDINESAVQAAKGLEEKVETKAEEDVVREAVRVEGEVEKDVSDALKAGEDKADNLLISAEVF
jgi:hypothetical protein